jgi:APA family basic amino acid/polyamine antiporter
LRGRAELQLKTSLGERLAAPLISENRRTNQTGGDPGPDSGLERALKPVDLIFLGVGAIVGVGIFVLTGQAAAVYAGPAVVLSFVFAGLSCGCAALCYSEMAAMIPVAGSAYSYARAALGDIVAWIIGWDLILEYSLASATVSVGWSGYVLSFLTEIGIRIPVRFASAPFAYSGTAAHRWMTTGAIVNGPAVFIALLTTVLLVLGIRASARFNMVLVIIKVCVVVTFILAGLSSIHPANWHPFIPANTGQFGHYGWSGIFRGAAVVFVAYIGFDAVSTVAQETENPQKSIPIGIIGSLIVCTVLYVLMAAVLTGLIPYHLLNRPDPIAAGIDATRLFWLTPIVKIGAIAGLTSVILVMMVGQSRIIWTMATDGLLPRWFARLHPHLRTPYASTVVAGLVVALAGGLLPIDILAEMVSIGTLFAFAVVCMSVWILRHKSPELARPFRVRGGPVVPLLGVTSCLYLMASLPLATWLRMFVWMLVGLVIYFTYARRHSRDG